jgi:hypothetical protein
MERLAARRRLTEAERKVIVGEDDIAAQRTRLAGLAIHRADTRAAWELLAHLEAALRILVANRDRLRGELNVQ